MFKKIGARELRTKTYKQQLVNVCFPSIHVAIMIHLLVQKASEIRQSGVAPTQMHKLVSTSLTGTLQGSKFLAVDP
jgi:hypothetical protein